MTNIKEFLYNFNEINQVLFQKINGFFKSDIADQIIIMLDNILAYPNFGYHLALMFLICAFTLFKSKTNYQKLVLLTKNWTEFFSIFLISLVISYCAIRILKGYFGFSRPFCAVELGNIHTIAEIISPLTCNHSFPSGHSAYITIFAMSAWSYLGKCTKILCIIAVIFVTLARIIAGAHYPFDIIAGCFISAIITSLVKPIVIIYCLPKSKKIMQRFFPWLRRQY